MTTAQVFRLIGQHAGYAATESEELECGGLRRRAEKHHV